MINKTWWHYKESNKKEQVNQNKSVKLKGTPPLIGWPAVTFLLASLLLGAGQREVRAHLLGPSALRVKGEVG